LDFKEFVVLLIKNKVDYLIVGGYVVAIHIDPVKTSNFDIYKIIMNIEIADHNLI
jgi:hypothetical protein